MSLYATPLDLLLEGAPAAALVRVASSRVRNLAASSGVADDSLRGRYTLPLQVTTIGETDYAPVTGSTATGTVSAAQTVGVDLPFQAYGIVIEVLSSGALGVATARMSTDGGVQFGNSFTVSSTPIVLSFGVTVTFSSGTYYIGDAYRITVSYGSLTSHVVSHAVYKLLRVRGVAPDGNAYDPIRDAYKEALKWFQDVRDLRVDPGLTDSSTNNGSDVFIEVPVDGDGTGLELDRRFQSTMGRGGGLNQWTGEW